MNRKTRIRSAVCVIAVATAGAVAGTETARAATVPAHSSPRVYCNHGGKIVAELPAWVSTSLRSEPVSVRFHLLQQVNGVWQYLLADDHYFTNYATSGGALLGGWLPDGNASYWGAFEADFYARTAGTYRVAMQMKWLTSGAYTYEWAGSHILDDPWNFIYLVGTGCTYS
jgi:hypothetical protein